MASFSEKIVAEWYRRDAVTWWLKLLRPIAWLFGYVVKNRRHTFLSSALNTAPADDSIPVVIVGNITVGGTGKSPLVAYLVKSFQALGLQPAIVSRGYGADIGRDQVRQVGSNSLPAEVGDEPLMLSQLVSCPIFVAPDRRLAVERAQEAGCHIVISDDGMQHYAMRRDIEICVLDASRFLGNGCLLPMGPLREPVTRLDSVDFIVINQQSTAQDIPSISKQKPSYLMDMRPVRFKSLDGQLELSVDAFVKQYAEKAIRAYAAIGNPERFFHTLASLGLKHVLEFAKPDHYVYLRSDFSDSELIVVMTEKDAVKCRDFGLTDAWVLSVEAQLSQASTDVREDKLGDSIYNVLRQKGRLPS